MEKTNKKTKDSAGRSIIINGVSEGGILVPNQPIEISVDIIGDIGEGISITKVELREHFIGSYNLIFSKTTPPYEGTYTPKGGGAWLRAIAFLSDGTYIIGEDVRIYVGRLKGVTITAPLPGTDYESPVLLEAKLIYDTGPVVGKRLQKIRYIDEVGELIGEVTKDPYRLEWPARPGERHVQAIAFIEGIDPWRSEVVIFNVTE